MKNIKYIVLFILVIVITGCSYKYATTTRNIRHSGFSVASNSFKCDSIFDSKEEIVKEPIAFYIGGYIFTETGYLYETNLGKVYSNNMNCKKPEFSTLVSAVFDLSIIKGTDNNYYYVGGSEEIPAYSQVTSNDEDYSLYDILLKENDVVKASTINSKEGIYYVLKRNGNIYEYDITKDKNNHYSLINSYVKYDYNDYGSTIIDFNYNGSSTSTFVKTENSYYRMKVTNSEECSKYADVNCVYEMALDDKLTEEYDQILAYNGSTLITKYGKIFNVNN
ncbi:MAG: hypothetical protein IKH54_07525 [Bacilli bacterium]|nr:hypothetical protein [Bacilli bacterium]